MIERITDVSIWSTSSEQKSKVSYFSSTISATTFSLFPIRIQNYLPARHTLQAPIFLTIVILMYVNYWREPKGRFVTFTSESRPRIQNWAR